jgi:hypothetical protein
MRTARRGFRPTFMRDASPETLYLLLFFSRFYSAAEPQPQSSRPRARDRMIDYPQISRFLYRSADYTDYADFCFYR